MKKALFLVLCLLALSGCSYTEPNAVYTVSAIGFSALEKDFEIHLQYIKVSNEGSKSELVSGRGETLYDALNDIKTKLNKTPSFSHCSLIALAPTLSKTEIKTALELCSKLNISLSSPIISALKIKEIFSISTGPEISSLVAENAKNFGFGGHTAFFEIQTALLVNEGRFSLPSISVKNNLLRVSGLYYYGEKLA